MTKYKVGSTRSVLQSGLVVVNAPVPLAIVILRVALGIEDEGP